MMRGLRKVKPCLIEWRMSTDVDPALKGMHTYYPWGVIETFRMAMERIPLRISGTGVYDLYLIWDDGFDLDPYVKVLYMQGDAAYRFKRPTEITEDFSTHKWYNNGKTYILEIRIKGWLD